MQGVLRDKTNVTDVVPQDVCIHNCPTAYLRQSHWVTLKIKQEESALNISDETKRKSASSQGKDLSGGYGGIGR